MTVKNETDMIIGVSFEIVRREHMSIELAEKGNATVGNWLDHMVCQAKENGDTLGEITMDVSPLFPRD